ncbi:MAG: translation initiation factor IF-6 [Candidatus Diapherotrites archaeon]|nr:translation initiation factor IF-6 [Candidatus Diapherotrites archaeon]
MKIDKGTVNSSPFVGVFIVLTDTVALVPSGILPKEEAKLKNIFDVEIIKTKLSDSSLLGVLCSGMDKKFVVSELALDSEIEQLESLGLEIKRIEGTTAIGNLIRVSKKGGIASMILTKEQLSSIEYFFGINFYQTKIASLDIVGSCTIACENGFIVNPNVKQKELEVLKKAFGTDGIGCTLNYGDKFVGNSAVMNSKAMLLGNRTTTYEILRIHDFFG